MTAQAVAVLNSCVGPTDAGVIDSATVEKIIDEGLRCTHSVDRLDWARVGSRRGGEKSAGLRRRFDDQRLV